MGKGYRMDEEGWIISGFFIKKYTRKECNLIKLNITLSGAGKWLRLNK